MSYQENKLMNLKDGRLLLETLDVAGRIAGSIAVTDSTEASVKTLTDGADNLPMEVTVAINPIQDLHGQESPWSAGGGKNKLPISGNTTTIQGVKWTVNTDGTITAKRSTTSSNNSDFTVNGGITLPAGSYVFSFSDADGSSSTYQANCKIGGTANWGVRSKAFTLTEDTTIEIVVRYYPDFTDEVVIKPMIRLSTEDSTFAPYSNVCPISGWDSVQITRTGRNLLNPNASKTVVTASGDRIGIEISTPGTYTMRNNALYSSSGSLYTTIVTNGVPASANRFVINSTSSSTYQIENGQKLLVHGGSGVTAENLADYITTAKIQLEFGSTASAYEPFGNVYPISLPTTAYGGTLTINKDGSGTLVSNMAIDDLGSKTWTLQNNTSVRQAWKATFDSIKRVSDGDTLLNAISSGFKGATINDSWLPGMFGAISTTSSSICFCVESGKYETADDFKTAVTGIQFCYELATPVSFDFTASQIRSLLGVNNLFADSGNVLNVVYSADNKLYIDQRIAELQALVLENINNV